MMKRIPSGVLAGAQWQGVGIGWRGHCVAATSAEFSEVCLDPKAEYGGKPHEPGKGGHARVIAAHE
jgi:hypothetical protein